MIRTIRNGIKFEFVPSFKWAYIDKKVVKIPDSTCEAGVWITYPGKHGYRHFKPNSFYSDEMVKEL